MSFTKLKKAFAVTLDKTARLTLYAVNQGPNRDAPPWLDLLPATEANKPYYNARLKAEMNEPAFRAAARGVTTVETKLASRRIDVELFPEHVIRGWGNVFDDEGKEVPLSAGAAKEYFGMLDWLFDEVRDFAKVETNFTDGVLDTDATAKK